MAWRPYLPLLLPLLVACGARTEADLPDANFPSEPRGAYGVVSRLDALELDCDARELSLEMSVWLTATLPAALAPVDGELVGADGTTLATFDAVGGPATMVPSTISAVPGSFVAIGDRDACDVCGTDVVVLVRFDEPRLGASAFAPARRLRCR